MSSQTGLFVFLFLLNCIGMVIFYLIIKSRFSAKKILSELRSEVDKLITDLGREADRDVELLESRVKNLRSLIDEADRRILVANREMVKKQKEDDIIADANSMRAHMSENPGVKSKSAMDAKSVGLPGSISAANTVPVPVAEIKAHPVRAPRTETTERHEEQQPVVIYTRPVIKRRETQIEPVVPLKEHVLEMAQKGISAQMIANTLSVSLGEVELILDMNSSSL